MTRTWIPSWFAAVALAGVLSTPLDAQTQTARVGDVTHLQGEGTNAIVGFGLVSGLNKTGDGEGQVVAMRAIAQAMAQLGAPVESLDDLKGTKNMALVMLEAQIPPYGAREGDRIDVVATALSAKSLVGGQLLTTPLVYHDRAVEGLFAFAQGPLLVDETMPTRGTVRQGARLERDVFINVVATGAQLNEIGFTNPWIEPTEHYVTLVLDDAHAGWPMAAAVAQALNRSDLVTAADVERVALAMDMRNIVVLVPRHQRNDLASWIRDVERAPLLVEPNEARVTINRKAGTIVISGDVRISPVIVSQAGLTITVANPMADGTVPEPAFTTQAFVAIEPGARQTTKIRDLIDALNKLNVPFADRVSILEQIRRAGRLHAPIIYEQ